MYRKKQNQREKTNKMLVYFIAFIMVSSVFGVIFYGYNGQNSQITFGDYKFYQKDDQWFSWFTKIDNTEAGFNYMPDEVSFINTDYSLANLRNALQIDTTYDPESEYASELALAQKQIEITLNNFNIYVRSGFTKDNEFGWPVITCETAVNKVPTIYFKRSNQTAITQEGNCIKAEFEQENDILYLRDKIIYDMLGILNG